MSGRKLRRAGGGWRDTGDRDGVHLAAMDQDSIDRIRSAAFPLERRGYSKREVDRFLGQLADWLEHGGDDDSRAALIRRELERVAEKTGRILTTAEDAAEQLRAEGRREAEDIVGRVRSEADAVRTAAKRYDKETRSEVDAYAERTRVEVDSYSEEVRADADAHATRTRKEAEVYAADTRERAEAEAAELESEAKAQAEKAIGDARAEAKGIVEEANRKRADIESVIADLTQRRDAVVGELERLASEVAGTATQHRPVSPADASAARQPQRGEGGAGAPDQSAGAAEPRSAAAQNPR